MKVILDRWIDLGELGQHQAAIVGDVNASYGEFIYLDQVVVGKINIRPLIGNDTRDMLIDELKAHVFNRVKELAQSIREAA